MFKPVQPQFFTTLNYPDHPAFVSRGEIILTENKKDIWGKWEILRDILDCATQTRVLILDSSSRVDILACLFIGFRPESKRPLIIITGDMWQKDKGLVGSIQRFVLRLADRAIFRYAPLSAEEFPFFETAWGISQKKLRFLPYFFTFTSQDLQDSPPEQENFIFAGGNAHRDYLPLVQAMQSLPEYRLVIASRLLDGKKLPANVIAGQLPRVEFIRKMRASRAVIVPIKQGLIRSTGHQTYLNGMLLGKPTIVNEVLGVREYTENGANVILVDGTPQGYVRAIRYVMSPENAPQIERMCAAAQKAVQTTYTFEAHCNRILEIMDNALYEWHREKQTRPKKGRALR